MSLRFAGLAAAFVLSVAAPVVAYDARAYEQGAFDAAVAAGGPVLVEVHAPWCSTCVSQERALETLLAAPEFAEIAVFRVDFDSQDDAKRALDAPQRSTLIAYRAGAETDRLVGATDPAAIEALLRSALSE